MYCRCKKKHTKCLESRCRAADYRTVCFYFLSSRIMALEEDPSTGTWREKRVCMGDKKTCSFPGLINHHHKFIISFAEDEAGFPFFFFFFFFLMHTSSSALAEQNSVFFFPFLSQVSSTSWPLPTPALLPLLGQFSSLWTRPGERQNSEEERRHRNRVEMLCVVLPSRTLLLLQESSPREMQSEATSCQSEREKVSLCAPRE